MSDGLLPTAGTKPVVSDTEIGDATVPMEHVLLSGLPLT